jgi:beta-galactosidase
VWNDFYYGVCYYPEHWHPRRHAADIRRMADCGFNVVRLGEGAWAYWEPREGQYRFEMFDRVIDLCRASGIKVIMGTPTYCAPAWVSSHYPEVLRWNYQRIPMAHGSRRNFNYTSPKYLDLSDRLCTALAGHYRGEKQIIGWQLDNEFNCHMDVSYAPSDTMAFRRWLRQRYRTLDRLNEAWGTRFWSQTYDDWDQINLPHPTPTWQNPHQLLDESRFISDCVVRFARRQADILRRHNRRWLITHNALFANINGPDLARVLDFFSNDQYPLFGNTSHWWDIAYGSIRSRSLSMPFAVLEQQAGPGGQMGYLHRTPRPGEMRLWAWQSIVHGARLLSYFRWRTCPYGAEQHWHGLLDQDNRDNRRLSEAKRVGAEIRALPRAYHEATVSRLAAVLLDYDNDINESRINTYTAAGRREAERWAGELSRRRVPVDCVWTNSDHELSRYRLLIAPHLKIMDKRTVARLARFVQRGGTLVLGAQSGLKDRNNHMVEQTPPGLLTKLAGVEVEDWTTLAENETREARLTAGIGLALSSFVERLRPLSAHVAATWITSDPLLAGSTAVTRNRVGKGTVWYVGGYAPAAAVAAMLSVLLDELKVKPAITAGQEIELVTRTNGRRKYLSLLNHSASSQRVHGVSGRDLLTGEQVSPQGHVLPAWGVAIVQSARGGRGSTPRR